MKNFFVKSGDFANCYSLCYTTDGSTPEGYERITRREAERLAAAEARRRKEDPSFAYFADQYIFPYSAPERYVDYGETDYNRMLDDAICNRHGCYLSGRVVVINAR